jgi:serine/threonine protein kinase
MNCQNCIKSQEKTNEKCKKSQYGDEIMEMEKTAAENFPLALPAGTVLAGKYVISEALGQGGFGITYVAEDYRTKEKVAIKEFFPDTMVTRGPNNTVTVHSGPAGENFVYGKDCFLEEAKTLAEFIGNENIVRVISYFEENGTAYFAMEYIEGASFQDYIKSHGGKVPWEDAKKILIPIIDALAAVHGKGIVHRDVTPDNIYITKEGVVKLLDFGAARYSLGDKSRSLDVVLKHGFAPKEQYTRHGRQGPFTDVYTVGASFYFALTGKKPPDAIDRMEEDDLMPPSNLGVSIPEAAEDAILKALNVQPQDRFQTMTAFKDALLGTGASDSVASQASAPQPAVSQTISQPVASTDGEAAPKDKKMWVMVAGICGIIVLLLVIIVLLLFGNKKNTEPVDDAPTAYVETSDDMTEAEDEPENEILMDETAMEDDAAAAEEEQEQEEPEQAEDESEDADETEDEPEESAGGVYDITGELNLSDMSDDYWSAVEDADYEYNAWNGVSEYPNFAIAYSDDVYYAATYYEGDVCEPLLGTCEVTGENMYTVAFEGYDTYLYASIVKDTRDRSRAKLLKKIKSDAASCNYSRYGVLWDDKDDNGLFVDSYAYDSMLIHRTFRVYDGYYMVQAVCIPHYTDIDDGMYKSYYVECIYRLCGFNANGKATRDFDEYWDSNYNYISGLSYPYPE